LLERWGLITGTIEGVFDSSSSLKVAALDKAD